MKPRRSTKIMQNHNPTRFGRDNLRLHGPRRPVSACAPEELSGPPLWRVWPAWASQHAAPVLHAMLGIERLTPVAGHGGALWGLRLTSTRAHIVLTQRSKQPSN